jgi:cobalamin-dependent methionine synthase I
MLGWSKPSIIDPSGPTRIIGECINPSGKSALRQALRDGDWGHIVREAQGQVEVCNTTVPPVESRRRAEDTR